LSSNYKIVKKYILLKISVIPGRVYEFANYAYVSKAKVDKAANKQAKPKETEKIQNSVDRPTNK